ncbi:LysM peptidoglycan-binding domain-containing protein [Corticibacter populi]|uniref:LysM peptidoglycan-binding domain-containing protein n=1 Tax=Corticibacter populi TaxID=1550736 RepID=A0A3M6QXR1_9BURK|nr:peptidoglycan DD-metalloendopeptidase family protein [Corticibacter populi]RMX07810.1 LysM peptidoglycan-binding domain-containing protein [Corticibacter populi]RZS35039.1 lipoprotein NlpD [Corticibacter populi]
MLFNRQWFGVGSVVAACLLAAGCSSVGLNRAPVEDLSRPVDAASGSPAPAGYYTVKPGDTLIRIGLETGQSWRDIASWNQLANADVIEVGQVLRIAPPGATPVASAAPAAQAQPAAGVEVKPIGGSTPAAAPAANAPIPTVTASTPAANSSGLQFVWPANGPLLAGFNEATNKGYDIGGNAGDPVFAAADGHVVYAGAGLRGYGNLIILKHNDQYLTAYAHNRALLVKEDQKVSRGQKIAEMGNTDADRVKLHFEVRRQGKPVNPAGYLPKR